MHGFNSGIYPGVGVPEAFQTAYFDFLRRLWTPTIPPPPHTTEQSVTGTKNNIFLKMEVAETSPPPSVYRQTASQFRML